MQGYTFQLEQEVEVLSSELRTNKLVSFTSPIFFKAGLHASVLWTPFVA